MVPLVQLEKLVLKGRIAQSLVLQVQSGQQAQLVLKEILDQQVLKVYLLQDPQVLKVQQVPKVFLVPKVSADQLVKVVL